MTGTMCVPCDPGTYTAHQSGLKECLQCKVYDPELGLVTRRECSSTSNTVCGCSPGHFCVIMKDGCKMCIPHQVCTTGQYMSSRGTERNNTICEKCQTGTFSPNGSLGQCLPWTNCTAQGLSEDKPGTSTTDALCSPEKKPHRFNIVLFIAIFSVIILIISGVLFLRKKIQERGYDIKRMAEMSYHEKIGDSVEADGAVVNFPVQETRQQGESPSLRENMLKSQDSQEP